MCIKFYLLCTCGSCWNEVLYEVQVSFYWKTVYFLLLKLDFPVYPLAERTLPIVIKWYILTISTAVSVGKSYSKHSDVIKCSVLFNSKQLTHRCRERDGDLYCLRCFDNLESAICGACRRPIEGRIIHALGKMWHPEVIYLLL